MPKTGVKIEKGLIRAAISADSVNEAERTFDITFVTETQEVERYDWQNDTYFREVLVCEESACRLKRLNSGRTNLLDNHRRGSVRTDILGVVVAGSAVFVNREGRCKIRLSQREDVKGILQDMKDGIISSISVGYDVLKFERQPIVDGETPVYRAIDWEVTELSLPVVAADIDCGVRSKGKHATESFQAELIDHESYRSVPSNPTKNLKIENMDLKARAAAVGLPETATEPEVIAAEKKAEEARQKVARKEATEAERTRSKQIRELGRKHKMPVEFIDTLVDSEISLDDARAQILDKLAEQQTPIRSSVLVTGDEEKDKVRKGRIAAMLIRSGQIQDKEISAEERELSKPFAKLSLIDIGRFCLEEREINTRGLAPLEITQKLFERSGGISSHTTDFPILLEGVNRHVLLAAYNNTPDIWSKVAAIGAVSDFREWSRARWGSITVLDSLSESGEYKIKQLDDASAEKVKVSTKGNIINISREMIINDDLNAFARLASMLGRAAMRSIEVAFFSLLKQNNGHGPTMADGSPLFHANHKNLIASGDGGGPNVTQVAKVLELMAAQTDPKNVEEILDLVPAIFLGPKGLALDAKVTNDSQYDPDTANKLQRANKSRGAFGDIVGTGRLTGLPWYSFADPNLEPVFEVSFLNGNKTPYLESDMPFNMDGLQWKVRHDFGVAAIGYLGGVMNEGN